jgi:two-component system, OmpR family, sensor histidine kinase MtrB
MMMHRHSHTRAHACARRPRVQSVPSASSDVLALIAHDLRLPLAALRLSSEMALDGQTTSAEQQHLLETVHRQVDALERLTLDLLDAFADGQLTPRETSRLDLDELAASVVDEFHASLGGRRTIILCGNGPTTATGNAAKLRVALRNIVANALKYSSDTSAVTVSVACAGGRCSIAVEDRGAGIDCSDLQQIFERDYRADSQRRGAPGHGLGLFIARQIVEAHGGRIAVESTPGAGSIFRIDLPATPESEHRRDMAHAVSAA